VVTTPRDDLGQPVPLPAEVRRVVSLVPSLTESVAATAPGLLAGATDWCTHPAGLEVPRVGGTKNPDVPRIVRLRPDVVLANEEENRPADLEALRAAGVAVWVTVIRDLDQALVSLGRMLEAVCGQARPTWLSDAERAWAGGTAIASRRRAVVPIWRRPWMVLGSDTFAGDVLARLGVDNVFRLRAERYPKIPLADLHTAGADVVVLPDEPYRFSAGDGPECFPGLDIALVSGRHLTWYGPSLAEAPAVLSRALRTARPGPADGLAGDGPGR
jgi:ABC-type Fe3+-hydroxamate transport system substrate-binding protein